MPKYRINPRTHCLATWAYNDTYGNPYSTISNPAFDIVLMLDGWHVSLELIGLDASSAGIRILIGDCVSRLQHTVVQELLLVRP